MRKQLMKAINEDLSTMETTGKVDLVILEKLNELRKFLHDLKNKWLEIENTDSYYFYQGLRNIELMLDKMQNRFEHAPEKNDNPKIASDSQILFQRVDDLLQVTESNEISNKTINLILQKTSNLRDVAAKQNLIEPIEVDADLVDKENVGSQLHSVMKNLDIPIDYDLLIVDEESKNSN